MVRARCPPMLAETLCFSGMMLFSMGVSTWLVRRECALYASRTGDEYGYRLVMAPMLEKVR